MNSSSSFKAHIGCYILAPEVEQILTITEYICSNKKCINHVSLNALEKSCPACHSPGISLSSKEVERNLLNIVEFCLDYELENPFDIVENDDGEYWLLNNSKSKKIGQFCEDLAIEITSASIDEKIKNCKDETKDILNKIKEIFGDELIIKFGVIPYYS